MSTYTKPVEPILKKINRISGLLGKWEYVPDDERKYIKDQLEKVESILERL